MKIKSCKELLEAASWEEHGWDNNTFTFSFGDFIDIEGDEYYFSIDYRKDLQEFICTMIYEDCSIVYGCLNTDRFFEQYLSKDTIEEIKIYINSIM